MILLVVLLIFGTFADHLADPFYLPEDFIKNYKLASETE